MSAQITIFNSNIFEENCWNSFSLSAAKQSFDCWMFLTLLWAFLQTSSFLLSDFQLPKPHLLNIEIFVPTSLALGLRFLHIWILKQDREGILFTFLRRKVNIIISEVLFTSNFFQEEPTISSKWSYFFYKIGLILL